MSKPLTRTQMEARCRIKGALENLEAAKRLIESAHQQLNWVDGVSEEMELAAEVYHALGAAMIRVGLKVDAGLDLESDAMAIFLAKKVSVA